MMHPEPLFHIDGQGINLYVLLHGMGFLPAIAIALWLAHERRYPLKSVIGIGMLAILSLLLWAPALVGVLRHTFSELPLNWAPAQVLTILLFLPAYRYLTRHGRNTPTAEAMDIVFPPAAAYIAFARLGCFSAGCCHGKPSWGLPWAVTFHNPHSPCLFPGIPVHPTQLYEAAGAIVICAVLLALRNRPFWRGALAAPFLIGYGLLRFTIEFYRGDPRPFLGPLSLAQYLCLLFAAAGILWVALRHRQQDPDATPHH